MKKLIIYLIAFACLLYFSQFLTGMTYYEVDKYFSEPSSYLWRPEGNISNIVIDGDVYGTGDVEVSLIKGGQKTIVFKRSVNQEKVNPEEYVELPEGTDIGLTLKYGTGKWDYDNDGLASNDDGVDVELKPIFFSNLNKKDLCTIWEVYSFETEEYSTTCYGNENCCNFLGYARTVDDWDEDFVLVRGNLGSTKNNIILSRIVFHNITHTGYSNYDAVSARFVPEGISNTIDDTSLQFESSNYLIRVEIEEDTLFHLKGIEYDEQKNDSKKIEEKITVKNVSKPFQIEGKGYIQKIIVTPPYIIENFTLNISYNEFPSGHNYTINPDYLIDSVYYFKIPKNMTARRTVKIDEQEPLFLREDDVFEYYRYTANLEDFILSFEKEDIQVEEETYSPFLVPIMFFLISIFLAIIVYGYFTYKSRINYYLHNDSIKRKEDKLKDKLKKL